MTTPKSPEQVVKEYEILIDKLYEYIPPQAPDSAWLRSSMSSLLLWVSEQVQGFSFSVDEKIDSAQTDWWRAYHTGYKQAMQDSADHIAGQAEEARKISNE